MVAITACGGSRSPSSSSVPPSTASEGPERLEQRSEGVDALETGSTFWDLFGNNRAAETNVNVNRYLWAASLEVLNFLPVESIDPFTGVIVTGYGTPPGGRRAYRATVLIDDPALSARALTVSLQSRSGTVSPDTVRAVENAILDRARQLRKGDNAL